MALPSATRITRYPAEWEPHDACWLAWPSAVDLWGDSLSAAQASFVQLCDAIADVRVPGDARGERLEILVPDRAQEVAAKTQLKASARYHVIPFGDIWLRDTAPIFVVGGDEIQAARFAFNGWGGKYILPGDDAVSDAIATASGLSSVLYPWVLEGGSVESDGEGALLTTRQCLLNTNRNARVSVQEVENRLKLALGARRVLWLDRGLQNDHTDGHIDTLARFVGPARVVCMRPSGKDDPNSEVLDEVAVALGNMRDASDRKLEVVRVPSPGKILDNDGELMPASYVNFYIANTSVVVPTYDCAYDASAIREIGQLFPSRRTLGVPARAILTGGGAFHCITQQQPKGSQGP